MPFVKISALPSDDFKDSDVMEAMEDAFALKAGLDIGTASFLWQTLDCMTHRKKGQTSYRSLRRLDVTEDEMPIFVELYITSVFDYSAIELIMETIADTLVEKTKITKENIFIHTQVAQPGQVYISGKVWPESLTHPNSEPEKSEEDLG